MDLDLSETELRVLACLIEKERATPDNYPLTTNALVAACNQKTSRDPVMAVTDSEVDAAMLALRDRGLARSLRPSGSRSWKHRQVMPEIVPLSESELAVFAVLALRGAQTAGELRTRTDRLHPFESVDEVDATLADLAQRSPALTRNIGRGPGQSQDRWLQLIGDAAPAASDEEAEAPPSGGRQRTDVFRQLHETGLFVMPNPWDRGSARVLQEMRFPALATTSSGFGRAIGKDDQMVSRNELVNHVADLTSFVTVPLNVDSERLFPDERGGIPETVRMLAAAGASGVSIEDYDPATGSIEALDAMIEAVAVAADSCREHDIVLTARAENHLYGVDDLDDTVSRLLAYQSAGAEVLYAPGLQDLSSIELVVDAIDRPLNVLARPDGPTIDALREIGVRRISTGGALYNATARTLREAAEELRSLGTSNYARG